MSLFVCQQSKTLLFIVKLQTHTTDKKQTEESEINAIKNVIFQ